jgi:hypothetical protein
MTAIFADKTIFFTNSWPSHFQSLQSGGAAYMACYAPVFALFTFF